MPSGLTKAHLASAQLATEQPVKGNEGEEHIDSLNPRLHIIGLGVSEQADLSVDAKRALASADIVIGSDRQLKVVTHLLADSVELLTLPKLSELKQWITERPDKTFAIMASGDPLYYGIGRWFKQHFSGAWAQNKLHYYPAISSIQAACHRLGMALQDVEVLSLHGRPLAKLKTRLRAQQPVLILTDKHSSPSAIAELCINTGFNNAHLTILEGLGYPNEKITQLTVSQCVDSQWLETEADINPLHITLLAPEDNQGYLPQFPGIPDQHFITDGEHQGKGMLTKREVRLQILSLMQPQKDDVVWDIGAGCGGVAVEMAYWQPDAQIYAVEHHNERLECLTANRERFGVVANLQVTEGRAPDVLAHLPTPNRVFVGGSDGELEGLLQTLWATLPEHGVLVASAVTETSKQQLLLFMQQRIAHGDSDGETLQVAISRGSQLAAQFMYRPNLPVSLFSFRKSPVKAVSKPLDVSEASQ